MNGVGVFVVVLIVGVVVIIPTVYLIVQAQRAKQQRVMLKDGTLSIADSATGVLKSFPTERIGAVVYLPARDRGTLYETSRGIWTWGGLLILDRTGRVVRHLVHVPGTDLPLDRIAQEIPAPIHRELEYRKNAPYSRRELLKEFPHALRFTQMRGATWWAVLLPLLICLGLPLLVAIVVFIVVVVMTLLQS